MHTIRLNKAVFEAHHGVYSAEQEAGSRFEVDVSMDVDFEAAASADDVRMTVDYAQVYALVSELIINHRFNLLERVAWEIGQRILQEFQQVLYVEVAVRKMSPPLGGPCSSSEVVFRGPRWPTT